MFQFFMTRKYLVLRTAVFVVLGISAAGSILYLPFVRDGPDRSFLLQGHSYWAWPVGGALYIGGAVFFATRWPERSYPARFDLCGQSHNIFHVAIVIACSMHFSDSLRLFE